MSSARLATNSAAELRFMSKVLITTLPFGDKNRLPIEQLEADGIEYLVNPLGAKHGLLLLYRPLI